MDLSHPSRRTDREPSHARGTHPARAPWLVVVCAALVVVTGCARVRQNAPPEPAPLVAVAAAAVAPVAERAADLLASTAELATPHPPSHDRMWRIEQAMLPHAEIGRTGATIHNVRRCRWQSEQVKQVRHETWRLEWRDVEGVDFVVVPFQDLPLLAHTMLAYRMSDGRVLVSSVEARLEQGERYSPVAGAARQYELMMVLGDEQDLYGLRAGPRGDDIYLYPSPVTPEQAAELLRGTLMRANQLASRPEYYDSISNNCMSNLFAQAERIGGTALADHWRRHLPSNPFQMASSVVPGLSPAADQKRRAWVSSKVRQHMHDADFSRLIRE